MPDYGKIITQTISIIKKNKWLFIYGLVLASFASGGSFSGSNWTSRADTDTLKQLPENLPEESAKVLGAFTDQVASWFGMVSTSVWALLIFSVLLLIVLGIVVRWVLSSWATGGLIGGFEMAFAGQEVNLKNTSHKALATIKRLIIFGLIVFAVSLMLIVTVGFIWLIVLLLFQSNETLRTIWLIMGSLVGLSVVLIAAILFSITKIYGERLIVLKNYSAWKAWKKAYGLSRKSFLAALVMGIINSVLGTAVGCLSLVVYLIALGVPFFIIIYPSIKNGSYFSLVNIIAFMVVVFLFVLFNLLVQASIVLFKFGNWNQIFEDSYQKLEGGNQ